MTTETEVKPASDRDTRTEQAHVGSWNVSVAYSGPYKGYGAQIDLYAFAPVDGAICSYHMGLPLEAGRALYAALRAVLYPADDRFVLTTSGRQLLHADPFEGTVDAFLADES